MHRLLSNLHVRLAVLSRKTREPSRRSCTVSSATHFATLSAAQRTFAHVHRDRHRLHQRGNSHADRAERAILQCGTTSLRAVGLEFVRGAAVEAKEFEPREALKLRDVGFLQSTGPSAREGACRGETHEGCGPQDGAGTVALDDRQRFKLRERGCDLAEQLGLGHGDLIQRQTLEVRLGEGVEEEGAVGGGLGTFEEKLGEGKLLTVGGEALW